MTYAKQLLKGSTYFFIGSVIAAIIAYLTKLVLVRNLSVEDYGLFFAVFTFILIFTIFKDLGLSAGLARFITEYNSKNNKDEIKTIITGAFMMQLIAAGILMIIFWLSSEYLAVNYFKDARAINLLKIMSLYLPLSTIQTNYKSIFQGLKNSKLFSFCQPIFNLSVLILVSLGIYLGINIYSPVLGYLGSFVLFFIIFSIPVLKNFNYFKYKHKNFFLNNKNLLIFSLPIIFTGVGGLIITYFDTLMLTYFDTLANVGIYNIIYPTALLIVMIGSSIGVILLPILTELWTLKKKKEIIYVIKTIHKYLMIISIPIILVLMTFSDDLIRIFFGENYLAGVIPFNILLVGALFNIFNAVNNNAIIAFKNPKKLMNIYILGAVLNIILNIILIPKYSLTGAAIASVTSFLVMLVISIFYVKQKINVKSPWKQWIITALLSLIIPLAPRLINYFIFKLANLNLDIYLTTISGLILGGIVYVIILHKIKYIDMNEIKMILSK